MKLNQILTESLTDINARIELANHIRRDIAVGELNSTQIARKYRVSKPRVTAIKKQMFLAGWMPGQPPDGALKQRRNPRRQFQPPPPPPEPQRPVPMPYDEWMRM